MTHADAVYRMCQKLFADYPLAISVVNDGDAYRSMVLVLKNGDGAKFFVLSCDYEDARPIYSLRPWRSRGVVDIASDDTTDVPDMAVKAVTRGVPIPRHGALLGWRNEDSVTALVATYTEYEPECPEPNWAVMPRAGVSETLWPPFTGQPTLGRWFWAYYHAGSIVSLDALIAATHGTVFWADTKETLGWDSCIIAADIRSGRGYTLNRGRYIYYRALREGTPVPALGIMLAARKKVDLAPRFTSVDYVR
jgi:hypothetical protein